jgi:DNA-binding SARP family transcriptional activator
VEVWLLGTVEVVLDGRRSVIAQAKSRVLMTMLALSAPHPVPTERLLEELWGEEQPAHPVNALQQQVAKLRRTLGHDLLVREGDAYRLAIDPDAVDAIRIERWVRDGREAAARGELTAAAERFEQALALVHGEVPSLGDHGSAREASARLGEVVLAAHEGLADVRLATGRPADVVESMTGLVRAHPLRERFHALLMLALYRCGRQADALRAYQDARAVLVEELGIDPGPELQALERAILVQDSGLGRVDAPSRPIAPSVAAGPEAAPLFGRDDEVEVLRSRLDELRTGRGGVTLIGGEPGIGKTHLAEALARQAVDRGVSVVWGRCYAGRGAPEFWPWIQVVDGLMSQFSDDQVRRAIGRSAPELAQLVPEIKDLIADVSPPPPTDPESARFHVYHAIGGFLRRLARVAPILVVLDDVHWADESSLGLVTFVSTDVADAPIQIVATYRTIDPPVGGPFADALAEIDRHRGVRRIDVEGLGPEAVAELVAASGQPADAAAIATLVDRTLGNPFFVTEIVRFLAATSQTIDPATVRQGVPSSVRGVIRQRVARLPEDTARTLQAAAVLGSVVDAVLLAAMLERDPASILDDLEPAVRAGIVIGPSGPVDHHRFAHGLVNETIYLDLPVGVRARYHQRAALALQAHHGDVPGPHLLPLAVHWFQAVPVAPVDAAIDASLRASAWAADHVAHAQAIDQVRAGLELAARLPDDRHRATRELELLDVLTGLLILRDGYAAAGFEQACARMRELSQRTDDRQLLLGALWRLHLYASTTVDFDAAAAIGHQLLEIGETTPDDAFVLAGHMAAGTAVMLTGQLTVAREHFAAAVAMCRDGRDGGLRGVVLESAGVWARGLAAWSEWVAGESGAADELLAEGVAIGAAEGAASYAHVVALYYLGWIAELAHDATVAHARADQAMALAVRGGYQVAVFLAVVRGWATAALGDLDAGVTELRAGSAAMHAAGSLVFQPFHRALLADVHLRHGRIEDALGLADEALAEFERTGERWWVAEVHRLRGDALAALEPADPAAVAAYRCAIEVAERQGARALRQRAEQSLARLTG